MRLDEVAEVYFQLSQMRKFGAALDTVVVRIFYVDSADVGLN